MERLSTGSPETDQILCGGFPARSINVLMGGPGSGKTILGTRMAFANLRDDRPVLYVSTVSEPTGKLIGYLQALSFCEPEALGTRLVYEPLGDALAADPLSLVDHMQALIRRHRPHLVIIDSFKAIPDLIGDLQAWRRLLYELAGLLSAFDATTLWIGEWGPQAIDEAPEFAVADGILELGRRFQGTRDDRFLRVVKLRGSDFIDGHHAFHITTDGLKVFPRLVTPDLSPGYLPVRERIPSGTPGLDAMLEDGVLRGSATLVAGPAGAGKTILSLQFLMEGVRRGEAGLLVVHQENPVQISRVMEAFGWAPERNLGPGKLEIYYTSPVEMQIDTIVTQMRRRVDANDVQRLVIDSTNDLERSARDPVRFRDYMYALYQYFARKNVTAFLVGETPDVRTSPVSHLSDTILYLQVALEETLERSLHVVKSRETAHDLHRRRIRISTDGLAVA